MMIAKFADRFVDRLVPRATASAGEVVILEWRYRCISTPCPQATGWNTSQKRYCSGGSCSGWEPNGCCPA